MSPPPDWLQEAPATGIRLLRGMRTLMLRWAGPVDWLLGRMVGRTAMPPLWLRRHTGPLAAFDRARGEMAASIALLGLLKNADCVLDIGCGCGAMAFEFQQMLGERGKYVGFDVHQPSIDWCRRHFKSDHRLQFEVANVASAWSNGPAPVLEYRFPIEDDHADFVLAK